MKKVKLGEVCEILSGYAFKSSQFNDKKIGLPLIRIRDVERGFSDTYFEGAYPEEYLIKNGDLLITMDGSFILKKWEGDLALLNQRVCKIKITDKSVDEGYLAWLIPKFLKEIEDKTPFVTVKHLSVAKIKDISFVLPNKLEQKLISKRLNTISQIYDFRKIQSEGLNELVKSRFNEMFGDPVLNEMGWDKHALKEFGIWKSGGTPKRNEKEFFRGNIPWITSGELEHKYIENSFEKISEKAIECSSAKIIEKGSLLLGMYDTAGLKSSINTRLMSCNQAIAFAKLDDKITNTIYVYYVIQNLRSMLLNQQRGVRQKNFNLSMIKNIFIPLPPLSLQNEFADLVAQVDKSQFACQKAIKLWRNSLKSSII